MSTADAYLTLVLTRSASRDPLPMLEPLARTRAPLGLGTTLASATGCLAALMAAGDVDATEAARWSAELYATAGMDPDRGAEPVRVEAAALHAVGAASHGAPPALAPLADGDRRPPMPLSLPGPPAVMRRPGGGLEVVAIDVHPEGLEVHWRVLSSLATEDAARATRVQPTAPDAGAVAAASLGLIDDAGSRYRRRVRPEVWGDPRRALRGATWFVPSPPEGATRLVVRAGDVPLGAVQLPPEARGMGGAPPPRGAWSRLLLEECRLRIAAARGAPAPAGGATTVDLPALTLVHGAAVRQTMVRLGLADPGADAAWLRGLSEVLGLSRPAAAAPPPAGQARRPAAQEPSSARGDRVAPSPRSPWWTRPPLPEAVWLTDRLLPEPAGAARPAPRDAPIPAGARTATVPVRGVAADAGDARVGVLGVELYSDGLVVRWLLTPPRRHEGGGPRDDVLDAARRRLDGVSLEDGRGTPYRRTGSLGPYLRERGGAARAGSIFTPGVPDGTGQITVVVGGVRLTVPVTPLIA